MHAISSTDPDAVKRLKDKYVSLQAQQAHMKKINAAWRKAGKPTADDQKAWEDIAVSLGCAVSDLDELRADMRGGWRMNPQPYESWRLSNNNQNMASVKKRIDQLSHMEDQLESESVNAEFDNGISVEEQDGRICILFPGKPDEAVRSEIKSNGYRWAPSRRAWVRKLTPNAVGNYKYRLKGFLAEL